MAWLGAQGHTLPEEGVVVAREHLFAIISADVPTDESNRSDPSVVRRLMDAVAPALPE